MITTTLDPSVDAEFARIVDELTRRGFLAGGLGSAALLGLAACGSSGPSGDSSAVASGCWSFADDLGRTVTLDQRPRRVAVLVDAAAGTLWASGVRIVSAPLTGDDAGTYLELAGASAEDVRGVLACGASGKTVTIDLERLAAAKPDLIVDTESGGKLTMVSKNAAIAKIAPVVAMSYWDRTVDQILSSFERLATALGAGTDAGLQADKAAYDQAQQRLRTAITAKPGLRVLFCFLSDTNVIVQSAGPADSGTYGTLRTWADLGMNLVLPKGEQYGPATSGVSWENLPDVGADLVITFGGTASGANVQAWKAMPAVAAGQVLELTGNADDEVSMYSYRTSADLFATVAHAVENARAGVGPN